MKAIESQAQSLREKAEIAETASSNIKERASVVHENAETLHEGLRQTEAQVGQLEESRDAGVLRVAAALPSVPSAKSSVKKGKAPKPVPADSSRAGEAPDHESESPSPEPTGVSSKPFPIVGIGASAGGYEAFTVLLKALPAKTGMAFILVQHLDPTHESKLSQLLAQATKMKVMEIQTQVSVEANCVYVIPPNRYLTISHGILFLHPRKQAKGPPMPIDHFLSSLARDQGNRAIGIVLSGNGVDGTLGLKEIKAEGGITFAQDERTSKYHGMPSSAIAAGSVDFVLSPELIGRELERIADHPGLAQARAHAAAVSDTGHELAKVFTLISAHTDVDFSHYKQSTLKRRIFRRMVLKKMEDLRQYVAYLHQNPAEVEALFQDILINVTSFFRDAQTFNAIKKRVLPKILKSKKPGTAIRIWVPGCSTGEEVYSLAICVHELLSKTDKNVPMQLFATDISETAIAKARAGIYPEAITSQVSQERLRRYFIRCEHGYQIAKFIRDACVFARQNLVEDPPFSKLDLISCRNVLIYLGPALQKKVIPIFHYALQSSGFLMLGTSETIGMFSDLFTLVDKKSKIYEKNVSPLRHHEISFVPKPIEELLELPKPPVKREDPGAPDLLRQVEHILLLNYAPSGVVINGGLEVLQFRGKTGPFLEHAAGEASLNLLKMAREGLIVDLRTTITKAMKTNEVARKESVRFRHNGHIRETTIEVVPFRVPNAHERFFLVLFHDLGGVDSEKPKRSGHQERGEGVATREVVRLREEIDATKESLQSIIEEQEATNEELKSANEEIQSSNEELQSTNEELETAKEELQSTNEELTTLNEELQNRNNELSQVNNDLSNLLSSVNIPMLMLGNDLKIRRFTPLAEKFFNLIQSDVGRRISDINPNLTLTNLDGIVAEVIDSLNMQEREVQDREGHWYSLRIRPYRTAENKIDGAVIVLVDIHDSKKALDEIAEVIQQPLLLLRDDLRVLSVNEAYCELFDTAKDKNEGSLFYQLGNGRWNIPALKSALESALNANQRVDNFKIEQEIPRTGRRQLLLSARRLYQNNKGSQLVIVTIRESKG